MKCNASILILAVIVALAAWGRWTSASHAFNVKYNPKKLLYFDEMVYIALGQYALTGRGYTTREVYSKIIASGRSAPNYLNDPLFKHPPLVPVLVGVCMKLASNDVRSAFLPGVVLGSAAVGAIYFLGLATLRDRTAALLCALLLALSPTQWICSARIFLEAPLAFFILAAIATQLCGLKCPGACWASATFWLLAWWTKYTSVPVWLVFQASLLLAYPSLWRSRAYRAAQLAALALYLPWWLWRLRAEGADVFLFWHSPGEEWHALTQLLVRPALWLGAAAFGVAAAWVLKHRSEALRPLISGGWLARRGVALAAGVAGVAALFLALEPGLLSFDRLPWTGSGLDNELKRGPIYTYFVRQAWFEPVTFLGMTLGLVIPGPRKLQVLKAVALGTAVLVTLWGNYQMRYFLPTVPLWEVLSVAALCYAWRRIEKRSRPAAGAFVAILLGWSILRSAWLVAELAIPNDAFYF